MQKLKEDIKQKIIEVGKLRFRREGYENTSMKDIASDAGISTGNIYRYFLTKKHLLNEILKEIEDEIQEFFEKIPSDYENVNLCDKASQDLLHDLELGNSKKVNGIAHQLSKVRKARRIYKDYIESCQPLIDLLETNEGKIFMKKLSECLGATRKIEKGFTNRKYFPRVIKELTFLKPEEDDKNE